MKASKLILFRSRKTGGRPLQRQRIPAVHILLFCFVVLSAALLLAAAVGYVVISQKLPPLEEASAYYSEKLPPSRFYDRSGEQLLLSLGYEHIDGQDLALCEEDGPGCFPQAFVRSVIATRDPDFETHRGASFSVGASETIAEEMADDIWGEQLPRGLSGLFLKKLLAVQLTQTFGREQLLTWYLNNAWFGQYAFGVDAAAQTYLNKGASEMSEAECILMSAIIRSPALNPIDSAGAVRSSYLTQIDLLDQAGVFSREQIAELRKTSFVIYEPPALLDGKRIDVILQKAIDAVSAQIGQEQLERGGLTIRTSEDAALQNYLNCIAQADENVGECPLSASASEEDLDLTRDILSKAPVSAAILDVSSGELLAALEVQGDVDEKRTAKTSLTPWQSGSNLSIFTALYAFRMGLAPSSLLWDLESSARFAPDDYAKLHGNYEGPLQLREAVTQDTLRPLSELLQTFGSSAVLNQAALFGLSGSGGMTTDNELSFTGVSVSTEDMAYALLPIASLGTQSGTASADSLKPVSILSAQRFDGESLDLQPVSRKSILDPGLAYLVHHVLAEGSQAFSALGRPAGSKSASVLGSTESWMSGYTPQVVCAVHIGAENTQTGFLGDEDRVERAARVTWRSIMEKALQDKPAVGWERPENVRQVRVCLPSGKLPTEACPETVSEVFLAGNEPQETDDLYVTAMINRSNQLLATRFTPAGELENKTFINPPEVAADWARDAGKELLPTEYDPILSPADGALTILEPQNFSAYQQESGQASTIEIKVDISLTDDITYYQVSSGQGLFPETWTQQCLGEQLETGKWLLCTLNSTDFEPGLYDLHVAIITAEQRYYAADSYVVIQ